MSGDPREVWRSRPDDAAAKKFLRSAWPELAAALDPPPGASAAAPPCFYCGGRRTARGLMNDKPACTTCVGHVGGSGKMRLKIIKDGQW